MGYLTTALDHAVDPNSVSAINRAIIDEARRKFLAALTRRFPNTSDLKIQERRLRSWLSYIERQLRDESSNSINVNNSGGGGSRSSTRSKRNKKQTIVAWMHHCRIGRQPEMAQWYQLLTDIVSCIRQYPTNRPVTVDGIARATAGLRVRPYTPAFHGIGRRTTMVALGCLTMLFEPESEFEPEPEPEPEPEFKLNVDVCAGADLLAPQMLGNHVIQQAATANPDDRNTGANAKNAKNATNPPRPPAAGELLDTRWKVLPSCDASHDELLHGSFLNFFTLARVARVKMRFVDRVSSHLVFDTSSKRMSVFAHPAFCAMCLDPAFDMEFQDRLFPSDRGSGGGSDLRRYYQEVMLSYRFLFAYDSKSQRQFLNSIRKGDGDDVSEPAFWKALLERPSLWPSLHSLCLRLTGQQTNTDHHSHRYIHTFDNSNHFINHNHNPTTTSLNSNMPDPPDARAITTSTTTLNNNTIITTYTTNRHYSPATPAPLSNLLRQPSYWPAAVIEADDATLTEQDNYDASVDFPRLGARLLHLQRYCARQNPARWTEIFWDQRHKQQWITLWAAIIIGGASVVLSLLQVVLTAVALRYP